MILTAEQLESFMLGALELERLGDVYRAHRLPAAMRPIYRDNPAQDIRMNCPACVRFRFVSDTTAVRIGVTYGGVSREQYRGNVLVDGRESGVFGAVEKSEAWDGVAFQQAVRESHVFDFWLPHQCVADIRYIELDDGCRVKPAYRPTKRWLAYGDSITQGMTTTLPALTYVARCALALDAEVINLGIGGAMCDERLADAVPDGDFDVISIAYGTNDFNHGVPLETYAANTRKLIEALTRAHPDTPIVLITTLTWPGRTEPNTAGIFIGEYRAALEPVAGEFDNVTLADGAAMLPDDPVCFDGGVHPNDYGMGVYAGNLLSEMKRALK